MGTVNSRDGKLYLELGGKLFDDYHASRVLPGFEPDSKLKMLLQLRNTLTGNGREDIQQVGDARFVLHVVAHHWRLIGVGHRTLELFHHRFRIFQQADNVVAVIVRLGHLLGRLQQRHHARAGLRNKRLWHFEHIAVNRVKALGDIAAQLQVLLLVFTHRHLISLIQQDIRRHQRRIGEETAVDVLAVLGGLVLKLRHARHLAERVLVRHRVSGVLLGLCGYVVLVEAQPEDRCAAGRHRVCIPKAAGREPAAVLRSPPWKS